MPIKQNPFADPDDVGTNQSANPSFDQVLQARLSRRSLLKSSFSLAATTMFGGGLVACGNAIAEAPGKSTRMRLNFDAVAKSLADRISLPKGYTASVLYRLGDPIASDVPAYKNDGTESGASFNQRAGDHHDGMHFFGLDENGKYSRSANARGLLVMNHESITSAYLHVQGQSIKGSGMNAVRADTDEVIKEINAHGASVIEVERTAAGWRYKPSSRFNRRITAATEMLMSGQVDTSYFITRFSRNGSRTRGTLSNCANGHTPWGTYLTCEENWNAYFRRAPGDTRRSEKESVALARYGMNPGNRGTHLWATAMPDTADDQFGRWNISADRAAPEDGSGDYRNAAHTYGWVVEIDPFAPASMPKKRTSMGRFSHENAALAKVAAGAPIVYYMGDDARGEYLYKYVSNALWDPADAHGGLAAGDKYLDNGRLYVARFNEDGSGDWIELNAGSNGITRVANSHGTFSFSNQSEVLLHARLAADAAGATKMDRPEWVAVHPQNGEVYATLTNNSNRVPAAVPGMNQHMVDAANPRAYAQPGANSKGNVNGHIIRWKEQNPAATSFKWDVFLFGARADDDADRINLSHLSHDNDFSSPDGLWFGSNGLLWIQTDDSAYTATTNCMLLAALPGHVGDGAGKTINNTDGARTKAIATHVGAPPGNHRLRRFLVGPVDAEITGLTATPDGKTLFVNIQHPGEDTRPDYADPASFGSHWPDGGQARPRSATIVITKNDGGAVGGEPA